MTEGNFDHENLPIIMKFGNKTVMMGTQEYEEEREKNTLAVRKSRQKKREVNEKFEEKLRSLKNENKNLLEQVNELSDELNTIIKTFSMMNIPSDLAENMKNLIERVRHENASN